MSASFDQRKNMFQRRRPFGRSSDRVCRHGQGETALGERELKTRGLVIKWQSAILLSDLTRLTAWADSRVTPPWVGHFYRQRLWLRRFRTVCQITYRRAVGVSMTGRGSFGIILDNGKRTTPLNKTALKTARRWFGPTDGHRKSIQAYIPS
jgi:hypothetical protein